MKEQRSYFKKKLTNKKHMNLREALSFFILQILRKVLFFVELNLKCAKKTSILYI